MWPSKALQLALVRKHERTAFAFGPAKPGRFVEALSQPVVLAGDHEGVVGTVLTRDAHGLGDQLPTVPPAPLARHDVELGQVRLLCAAPHRRLSSHHDDAHSRAAATPSPSEPLSTVTTTLTVCLGDDRTRVPERGLWRRRDGRL